MEKLLRVSIFLLAFFGVSTVFAAPPAGIQGDVTVQNGATNPVPVTIQNPAPAPIQTATEWRVVGVTTTQVNGFIEHEGRQGNAAMHSLCHQEVGPTTRACFAAEAKRPISTAAGLAWVIRSQNVTVAVSGADFIAIDGGSGLSATSPSGAKGAVANLDCADHISDSEFTDGQIVDLNTSATFPEACNVMHPIACCGPVEIPLTTLP
jgi:hypothetical protein